MAKASEVYTVHEMEAAAQWAHANGTDRYLAFEKWSPDGDGDGNAPPQADWTSQLEVWGNYKLGDVDMVHAWVAGKAWDAWKPDYEASVHGDGISGDKAWTNVANRPRDNLKGKCWCKSVPDTADYRNLRGEIQQGAAWPKLLANIRAEPRDLPPL